MIPDITHGNFKISKTDVKEMYKIEFFIHGICVNFIYLKIEQILDLKYILEMSLQYGLVSNE